MRRHLEKRNIDIIKLPPYSSDLNIIENVWAMLKKRVRKELKNIEITSEDELYQRILS